MQTPLYVRPLLADERATLETGLRSSSAFPVRRCQILLAGAEGQTTTTMAHDLRCTEQTVRNAIHAFHQRGLAVRDARLHETGNPFVHGYSATPRISYAGGTPAWIFSCSRMIPSISASGRGGQNGT